MSSLYEFITDKGGIPRSTPCSEIVFMVIGRVFETAFRPITYRQQGRASYIGQEAQPILGC